MENNYRASIFQRIAAILFSVSILVYGLPFVQIGWGEFSGFELLEEAFSYYYYDTIYGFLLIVALSLSITAAIIGYAANNSKNALRVMGAFGISVAGLWILWLFVIAGDINSFDLFDWFSSFVEPLGGFWLFLGLTITAVVLSFTAAGKISGRAGRRYRGRADYDYYDDDYDYADRGGYAGNKGFRRRGPSVVSLSGMYKGAAFPIPENEELIFGRDAAFCHVVITENAEKISRKHVTISFDPNNNVYVVTDNSSNGTYLADGSRLVANIPVRLRRGTIIYLAKRDNSFELS